MMSNMIVLNQEMNIVQYAQIIKFKYTTVILNSN